MFELLDDGNYTTGTNGSAAFTDSEGKTLLHSYGTVSYTHLDVYKRQVDDCVKFVEREIRRGNHYDGIIMDPPSYGRGPKGEIWKIEESIYPFIELTTQILSDDPLFFLINSYTTGLQPAVLNYMMQTAITPKFGGHTEASEIGLPVTDNGLVLPLSLIHIFTSRFFITCAKFLVLISSNFSSSTTISFAFATLSVRADFRAALFSFLLSLKE